MKWKKFTIKTITDAEDIIISTLYDIGLEGAQIEDKIPLTPLEKEQMFVDILPDGPEDDGIAYLSFFVEENDANPVNTDEITANIRGELDELRNFMDVGEGTILVSETEDIDWINNWKQFFHQFYICDSVVGRS
jgi:ribosomal protein L11 methyltransferase